MLRCGRWFSACGLLLTCLAPLSEAQEPQLLRAVSAAHVPARGIVLSIAGGYETGIIPTGVVASHLSYGIGEDLEAGLGASAGFFTEQEQRRLAHIDGRLQYRLFDRVPAGPTGSLYGSLRFTPGEAITVPYTGELVVVHTVVAEHADPGLDLCAGVTMSSGPLLLRDRLAVGAAAQYARTGLRDYYPAFEDGAYKNRLRANIFPFMLFDLGGRDLIVTLQSQYTYWFDRGSMLDLLPQVEIAATAGLRAALGVALPVYGGGVYKLLGRVDLGIRTGWEPRVRITVRDLHFPPNQAILFGPGNEKSAQNERRIARLYRRLQRYSDYRIVVEGHTSWVYWDDPVRGPQEQKQVLIPLSRARAAAVVSALADRGLPRERMTFVGKGASEPKVAFDHPDQWRNRRVEIVLVRE